MTIPEKAVQNALAIANDDSHGYDQTSRWGPDYDCSSLVITAYKEAGLPLACTYTGNMRADMIKNGFAVVQVNLVTGDGLRLGDVLLNERHHTAMYIGDGRIVHARGNERGGATGGKTGDQTGGEICTQAYFNFPWDCILRYDGDEPKEEIPVPKTYTVQKGDTLWDISRQTGIPITDLARINSISNVNLIFPGMVLKLSEDEKPEKLNPTPDNVYVVKQGDSLWQIAQNELGSGWRWYKIADANNMSAPYIIHPGQRLVLPQEGG